MKRSESKKLTVHTIGCRLNQYETERIASDLYPYGFRRAIKGEPADLCIINTCTVTHRADQSSRNMISRAVRENPDARIVVAGCYVDNDPELLSGMDGVDVVIGNADKSDISRVLSSHLPELFVDTPKVSYANTVADFSDYNRAWLKISDGCNQRCSFCILPRVRGELRNRNPQDIIAEINGLVAAGFREVVLTGVHVGHYRYRQTEPPIRNLAALCRIILDRTELKRIRISSIEPQTVKTELLQVCTDGGARICRHFHVPLQSGSSRILRLMRRPYDQRVYLKRLRQIRVAVPKATIGADVIVGFPGETDHDFEESRRVCESGLIDYLHVFSYSDRPNTHASGLPDKVNPQVIKDRNAALSRISNELRAESHRRQIGETLDVIAERKQKGAGFYFGISDNYVRVKLPLDYSGGREIARLTVRNACAEYVEGDLLAS